MQSYEEGTRELAAFFEQGNIELIRLTAPPGQAGPLLKCFPLHHLLLLHECGAAVLRARVPRNSCWVLIAGEGRAAASVLGKPLPARHLLLAGMGTAIDLFVPGKATLRIMIIGSGRSSIRPGMRILPAGQPGGEPTSLDCGALISQIPRIDTLSCAFDSDAESSRRVAAVVSASRIMERFLARPISMRELAGRCGVAERTLEYGFRQVYDTTPLAFIRSQRLSRCRQLLLNSNVRTTIRQAAGQFGFTHMGQFATDYRHLFGETPSITLARGRSALEAAHQATRSSASPECP